MKPKVKRKMFSESFSTTWRKALISLPRLVPDAALHITNPDGPHPFVVKLPARDPYKHEIPVYVFLYVGAGEDGEANGRSTPKVRTPKILTPKGSFTNLNALKHRSSRSSMDAKHGSHFLNMDSSAKASTRKRSTTDLSGIGANDSRTSMEPKPSSHLSHVDVAVSDASTPSASTTDLTMLGERGSRDSADSRHSTDSRQGSHLVTHLNRKSLNLPVLVDFHGGSFILGTPQEQAPFCAQMAREIGAKDPGGGCVVLSVDYRLGPYSQYPAANEDAEDIVRAILVESSAAGTLLRDRISEEVKRMDRQEYVKLDKERIALSGFSSGGNIALTLAMSSKNDPTIGRHWPSIFPEDYSNDIPIVLFYPSLDSRMLPDERPRPPGLNPPTGFFARMKIESELMPKYMSVEQRSHPRASPGLGEIQDGGLHPKARIILVLPELDSLSDQSMCWVNKVKEAGREEDLVVVPVPGVMHGWTQFPSSWLKNDEERYKKKQVFEMARGFLQGTWEVDDEEG